MHMVYDGREGGRIPIASRVVIPDYCYHAGKRLGDIVIRPAVGLPLVICGWENLDDGSGVGGFVFFEDRSYQVIGSIYEPGGIDLLRPFLESRSQPFDWEFYGLVRPETDPNMARGYPDGPEGKGEPG